MRWTGLPVARRFFGVGVMRAIDRFGWATTSRSRAMKSVARSWIVERLNRSVLNSK